MYLDGDFNIDLLKCEMHEDSNAFLNSLSSSFLPLMYFSPQGLHPNH